MAGTLKHAEELAGAPVLAGVSVVAQASIGPTWHHLGYLAITADRLLMMEAKPGLTKPVAKRVSAEVPLRDVVALHFDEVSGMAWGGWRLVLRLADGSDWGPWAVQKRHRDDAVAVAQTFARLQPT